MTVYVWHHVVVLSLCGATGMGLSRARWTHRSPHVAVLLWQTVALGAVAAAIGLLLTIGLAPYRRGIVPALGQLASERAPLDTPRMIAVAAGLTLAFWAVAVQVRCSWQARRHRARHRLLLRLVARAEPHAMVLDHPAAAAYYVPGHSGCVVISTGALAALTTPQLAAVLAHEHAHARERHHLVLAPFHALRWALPCRATVRAVARVELLLEMCADDRAARRHGAAALVGALRRFTDLGTSPAPPGALAAADQATLLRIQRLRRAEPPLNATLRAIVVLAALVVAATPISLFVLPA